MTTIKTSTINCNNNKTLEKKFNLHTHTQAHTEPQTHARRHNILYIYLFCFTIIVIIIIILIFQIVHAHTRNFSFTLFVICIFHIYNIHINDNKIHHIHINKKKAISSFFFCLNTGKINDEKRVQQFWTTPGIYLTNYSWLQSEATSSSNSNFTGTSSLFWHRMAVWGKFSEKKRRKKVCIVLSCNIKIVFGQKTETESAIEREHEYKRDFESANANKYALKHILICIVNKYECGQEYKGYWNTRTAKESECVIINGIGELHIRAHRPFRRHIFALYVHIPHTTITIQVCANWLIHLHWVAEFWFQSNIYNHLRGIIQATAVFDLVVFVGHFITEYFRI